MLFNSIDFAVFLPIVFLLYWFVVHRKLKYQNLLILGASYVFYGWWDYRFLTLIVFSTVVDFLIGLALKKQQSESIRRFFLWLSISVNIGFLAVFKYCNFFVENFIQAFSLFGIDFSITILQIILPVGISFYTFQTLSYTIDVYKRKLNPTNDFVAFAAFVSFFPQLVAGPIERATNLLPQFFTNRSFEYAKAVDGLRQILWGLFKKVVVADNCAKFVNIIFNDYSNQSSSTLLIGAVFFAFQIYGDFSGYSDVAIGTSRLFGFDLKQNFAFPYFSRDMAEFWRRWHISLSTWFRDYLYIPLGGSRMGQLKALRNTFVIFIVSGFWHGANWTFIVWGGLNAVYFFPLLLAKRNRRFIEIVAIDRKLPSLTDLFRVLITFFLTCIAWIFFRSETLNQAIEYIMGIFENPGSYLLISNITNYKYLWILILFFTSMEWIGRRGKYAIEEIDRFCQNKLWRWVFYFGIAIAVLLNMGNPQEFIYFQF